MWCSVPRQPAERHEDREPDSCHIDKDLSKSGPTIPAAATGAITMLSSAIKLHTGQSPEERVACDVIVVSVRMLRCSRVEKAECFLWSLSLL